MRKCLSDEQILSILERADVLKDAQDRQKIIRTFTRYWIDGVYNPSTDDRPLQHYEPTFPGPDTLKKLRGRN